MNLHDGHRKRVAARFEDGGYTFRDMELYALLELLLFPIIPRRDTNVPAHLLAGRFGGLSAMFEGASLYGELAGLTRPVSRYFSELALLRKLWVLETELVRLPGADFSAVERYLGALYGLPPAADFCALLVFAENEPPSLVLSDSPFFDLSAAASPGAEVLLVVGSCAALSESVRERAFGAARSAGVRLLDVCRTARRRPVLRCRPGDGWRCPGVRRAHRTRVVLPAGFVRNG